jgi:endonuclease YncB( thermonuclease family)
VNIAAGAIIAGLSVLVALAVWPAANEAPPTSTEASVEPPVTVTSATRNVTPPGIVPGPAVEGPLTRLHVPAPPPPPPRWHRFFRPLIAEAGLFEVKGKSIRLRGLEALPVDAKCAGIGGAEWSCGRAALIELRRLIRGRAIECNFSSGDAEKFLIVPCRVAITDIALWLADRGWARAATNAPPEIREAAHAAECAGLGIWRDRAARGSCP